RQGRSREWDKNQSSKRPVSARGFAFGRGFLETIPLWGLVLHTVDPGRCCIARGKALGCRNFVVKPLTSYTCKLSDEQASLLKSWLQAHGYKFREVTYARFAAEKEKTNLVFYESGKLVVQGKGTQEFIEFVLEPEILKEARLGYEAVLNPDLLLPRLGVDESGKGDFFGPLCVAGAYVNAAVVHAWRDRGIKDSKSIGSDKRISELAKTIRETPGGVYTVVPIGNQAHNRPLASLTSVNDMLAWGHARVIENLMLQKHRMNPPPVRAISDQFASNKEVVGKALMSLGR